MAIFEVRIYPVREGGMDEWVAFMHDKVRPFIEKKGMKVEAMFRGVEDPNRYIFIRSFKDAAHREALTEAVYGSQDWQENYKPTVRRLVDVENSVIHVMTETSESPMK
ncbi:MAG: NIPSNAP family protein [Rhizobiaceae bacterium]